MTESNDWRNNLERIIDELSDVASDLDQLARAADTMGNTTLGYKLWTLKGRVVEATLGVKDNKNRAFQEWIDTVNAGTKNMINAALATTSFAGTLLTQEQQSNES